MKSCILIEIIILTALSAGVSFAQLPLQVEPKIRGFIGRLGKPDHDEPIIGRNVIETSYRLNRTFLPFHYDLEMRVILDNDKAVGEQFTAPGKVRIFGVNQEKTKQIVLHANELSINESSVAVIPRNSSNATVPISGFSTDEGRHLFVIELAKDIGSGEEYEIYVEFEARIIRDEKGLFYRTYKGENGEQKLVAATQFESTDARRMFPCFDEPDLKATFELTLIRRDNYTSISNAELISSIPDPKYPGWVIDKFARTVKMSTYLLAFSIFDYGYAEAHFGKKRARTYAPKQLVKLGTASYSVNVAAKCLSFYESYFNESYKLSKLDSVAIPGYTGAMENWGMNVYGIPHLLYYPGRDSETRRSLITLIIAHELAHQWFGNLVTAKWWNDIFINEGLSSYVQYLGLEAATPEFDGFEIAILDAVQYSLLYDAGPSTHPMSFNVSTPEEIDDMFSTITYEKGASVFRMMENILGKETLKKGLQIFLRRMAYKGATQDDLFDCLQEGVLEDKRQNRLPPGVTVHDILHSWTDQSGFPIVRVQGVNETHVQFSQTKFVNEGFTNSDGLWYVPITIVTGEAGKVTPEDIDLPLVWLKNDGVPVTVQLNKSPSDWLMINHNATGFYRVLYDASFLQLIQQQLDTNANAISPLSRSQLLDDYFVFAEQKYVNFQVTLNLTRYLHQETHFTVWSTFIEHFTSIYEKFSSHPAFPLLKSYLQPKVDKVLLSIGLEETPAHKGPIAILRADLLDWSCSLESPLCREYAGMLFAQWEANPSIFPFKSVDARNTLQCAMVAAKGRPAFDFIFKKYREAAAENEPKIRENLLNALACSTNEQLLNELLMKTLNTSSGLLLRDGSTTYKKVAMNPLGRTLILKFLSKNFDYIVLAIGNGTAKPITDVLYTLATYYTTEDQLKMIQKFIDHHEARLQFVLFNANVAVDLIKDNISWMEGTGSDIWAWLWLETQHKNNVINYE